RSATVFKRALSHTWIGIAGTGLIWVVFILLRPAYTPGDAAYSMPASPGKQGYAQDGPGPAGPVSRAQNDSISTSSGSILPGSVGTPSNTPAPCAPVWSVVSSPNLTNGNNLNGVAAVSTNDVWAVGSYVNA